MKDEDRVKLIEELGPEVVVKLAREGLLATVLGLEHAERTPAPEEPSKTTNGASLVPSRRKQKQKGPIMPRKKQTPAVIPADVLYAWKDKTKVCAHCDTEKKAVEGFGLHKTRDRWYLYGWCAQCRRETNYHARERVYNKPPNGRR